MAVHDNLVPVSYSDRHLQLDCTRYCGRRWRHLLRTDFAIYTTRIAKRSAFIARVFSILPIVTPPFIVGLGVTLMLGRSGYITELMGDGFGIQKTNWLYGFTGIWLAQVLAFAPMSFMILDGALKSLRPSLE